MNMRRLALAAGPLVFILVLCLPAPETLSAPAQAAAAITLWITIWWITEPVPVSVTALLPLVLFPLLGIAPLKSIASEFGHEIIFLFMGGMFFGQAIERWNLHQRIALRMVLWLGDNPGRMLLGFMLATGFLSMWISNTATAVMMTPVAIAVGGSLRTEDPQRQQNFGKSLMLGVAYACSIGGLATIIGTPTNAIFIGFAQQKLGMEVSFWRWFLIGFPFALLLLLICWVLLLLLFPLPAKRAATDMRAQIQSDLARLGSLSPAEYRLMLLFGLVVAAWISGGLLWYRFFPNVNDTIVALCGALALFLIPAGQEKDAPLLSWDHAMRIPWGVLLFFGGGLALAKGFDTSGLAAWIGQKMEGLRAVPHIVMLLSVFAVVVVLSEIASNVATASMMMPVLAALASGIGLEPSVLLLSAAMAASIGFGLPVATAPNAIVFSSGFLNTRDMARAGFLLDLAAIALLLLFAYTLIPLIWGISL